MARRCGNCIHKNVCELYDIVQDPTHAVGCGIFLDTSDVVPKSDVEALRREIARLEKALCNSLPSYCQVMTEKQVMEIGKAYGRREVAREIFEEIERKVKASITIHLEEINKEHIKDTPLYDRHSGILFALQDMDDFIAELKKKYTEGE